MYAVIKTGGKQYRVAQGDRLKVEKLVADVGGKVSFEALLVVALTWGLVKHELRDYCAWKGLAPGHFGL